MRPAALPGGDVSRETAAALAEFEALLRKWNRRINLVSPRSLDEFATRHLADSAQLLELAPDSARLWADLGSGGGFPGLVVAVLARERRPEMRLVLVEADRRKAAFLRTAAAELGLPVEIRAERIETTAPIGADVVSARALAPLRELIPFARRHLAPGGVALFPKGARHDEEITQALAEQAFTVQKFPSHTAPEAAVLRIEVPHEQ